MVFLRCITCSSPTYLTPKSPMTSVNCTGLQSWVQKPGKNWSVGSLSCWVSFAEAHWLITLLGVNLTCLYWLGCVFIPRHLLSPWVYIRWWSHWGFPWYWCECIPVIWGGSWGKNSRCPWSWTCCFLWRLHYWKVFLLPKYILWVLLTHQDSWFGLLQRRNGFCFSWIFHCVHCRQRNHKWHPFFWIPGCLSLWWTWLCWWDSLCDLQLH